MTDEATPRVLGLRYSGPGLIRIVYLQHGSDQMVWLPFVTMWQVAADLPAAGFVPEGLAHLYNLAHLYKMTQNAHAWIALTQPEGWTDADAQPLLVAPAELQIAKADA